ncbi:hypothetical protein WOLCODRAFT_153989 [Wolfiporia cocos MD-104 SS10]|uniref:Uncharacterized protein n=1 Tax=Wolfiporia cocos (strain MD-104) TaxID=742152 RepID=A0A2H3K1E2_WOLCO|nr:hypothetical protein WOLCODRAFT_153989 [Wolfiporia cocos MD-104 SS10]
MSELAPIPMSVEPPAPDNPGPLQHTHDVDLPYAIPLPSSPIQLSQPMTDIDISDIPATSPNWMEDYPLLEPYDDDTRESISTTSTVLALGHLAESTKDTTEFHNLTTLQQPLFNYSICTHHTLSAIAEGAIEFAKHGLRNHRFVLNLSDELHHLTDFVDQLIQKRGDDFSDCMDESPTRPTSPSTPPAHTSSPTTTPPSPPNTPPIPSPPIHNDTLQATLQLILACLDALEAKHTSTTPPPGPTTTPPSNTSTNIHKQPPTNIQPPPKKPHTDPPQNPQPALPTQENNYDMHLDDNHFPSLPTPSPPEFTTVRRKHTPKSYADTAQVTPTHPPTTQPPPAHPHRPTADIPKRSLHDKLKWVIRFGNRILGNFNKNMPVDTLCSCINTSLHKAVQTHDTNVTYIKWMLNNNIILYFKTNITHNFICTNIVPHIRQEFSLPDHVVISQNIPWARLVLQGVPCHPYPTAKHYNSEELENTLRHNRILSNVALTHDIRWLHHEENMLDLLHANVVISFEDPTGKLASAVKSATIGMFGKCVTAVDYRDKPQLVQCRRCWKLGHASTPKSLCRALQICHQCGDNHAKQTHHRNCYHCQSTGSANPNCTYTRCAKCGGPHFTDNIHCPHHERYRLPLNPEYLPSFTEDDPLPHHAT